MNQRREPTISSKPSTGDRDAPAHARRDPRTSGSRQQPERVVQTKSSPLVGLALLVAGLGVCLAGFAYWQMIKVTQEQVITQANASALETRILELEKKLVISDGESTQSLTSVQLQVKENMSEIRKLWGISYDRNRNAISDLGKELKKEAASIKALGEKAKKEQTKLTKSLASLRTELALVRELYDDGQTAVIEAGIAAKEQTVKSGEIETKVKILERDLTRRVIDTEEAIESIDAFRKQVNRDLTELKQWTQGTSR